MNFLSVLHTTFLLRNRYIPALVIIALFTTASYIYLIDIFESIKKDGQVINISGRQRMLSQKLILLSQNYQHSPTQRNRTLLKQNIQLMEQSHHFLMEQSSAQILEIFYHTGGLNQSLTEYCEQIRLIADKSLTQKTDLHTLQEQSQMLLQQLDKVVVAYENENHQKSELITLRVQKVFMLIMGLIVFLGWFIFYPASRKIKEDRQKLDEQKEYLDLVINSSKNAIVAIDQNLKVKTYNQAAQSMFGYTAKEMLDKDSLFNIIPEEYLPAHSRAVKHYMHQGLSTGIINKSHELHAKTKDGELLPIKISFGTQNTKEGKIVVANMVDMTKEMHYRKELSELNNSLEAKIEEKIQELKKYLDIINQHIIISTTDPRGIITYANDAFCKISGYTLDELIGQSHNIVRHPDMPQSCFRTLWETIKSGQEWRGKIKNRTKEGDYYWVDAVIKPHFNNDGQIDSYNTIRIDITDKIKLEELTHYQEEVIQKQINIANEERDKAKEYAKAKGDFLANMSHEIRTPLNAIVGFIEILKEEVAEEKLLDYVHTIDRSSQTLLQIIEDILDFSKIESGKLAIEKIFFNPYEEFKVITELFAGKCQQKNIQLHVHIDTSLPINIKSDALRLKQVISNLISNAVKFTDSEKNIFVRIEFNESRLLVSVKDEGKGIAEDKLEHIFEEFSQEDASTTRKYGGTGLGLAISSRLVQLLGGQLEVSSELQKGSIFYFSIPLSEKEISDTELQVPEHSYDTLPHIDGVKILLVEDNRANQMLMKVIFKKHKLNFDIANDGLEAIELFKQHKYDAILMDENMPNMSGTEATKAIIQIEKEEDYIHTPIIALTANAIKGDRERFLQEGMDDYLSKPINQKQLVEKLHRWIF